MIKKLICPECFKEFTVIPGKVQVCPRCSEVIIITTTREREPSDPPDLKEKK